MQRLLLVIFFFLTPIPPIQPTDVGKKIVEKLSLMKSRTHRNLAKTKDISALMERVDRDLLDLDAQKRDCADIKKFLIEKKERLESLLAEKKSLLSEMKAYNGYLLQRIDEERELVTILNKQNSIIPHSDSVAELVSRDTLLTQAFVAVAAKTMPLSVQDAGGIQFPFVEDVRG